MNNPSGVLCAERRTGIERRRYSYDTHIPDRRSTRQHRGSMDRRKGEGIDINQRFDDNAPEN